MDGNSSSSMSQNSSATRQASAPPPQVVPCMPGLIVAAALSLAMNTPRGRRQANRLGGAGGMGGGDRSEAAPHGRGPRVAEEAALQSAHPGQPLGQRALILVIVEIRRVDEQRGLFADDLDQPRVGVTRSEERRVGKEGRSWWAPDP